LASLDEQSEAKEKAKEESRKVAAATAGYSHTAALFAAASSSATSGYASSTSLTPGSDASAAQAPKAAASSNVVKRQPPTKITGPVLKPKAWRDNAPDKPKFPADFDIEYYNTLQVRSSSGFFLSLTFNLSFLGLFLVDWFEGKPQ